MTDDQKIQLSRMLNSYRLWPDDDLMGVQALREILLTFVDELIQDAVYENNEQRDYWDKEHE